MNNIPGFNTLLWAIVIVILLVVLLVNFGVIDASFIKNKINIGVGSYENPPEKCQPPPGQNLKEWIEHLSHHENTKECLRYFKS